jgi:hypothetical protein
MRKIIVNSVMMTIMTIMWTYMEVSMTIMVAIPLAMMLVMMVVMFVERCLWLDFVRHCWHALSCRAVLGFGILWHAILGCMLPCHHDDYDRDIGYACGGDGDTTRRR